MKRIIALIAAFALAVPCFSCEDKKNDDESSVKISAAKEISDTPGASEEPVVLDKSEFINASSDNRVRTYTFDDFREINVPLTYTDEESPVICNGIEITDFDFGERLSPCKKSEDPSQFDPYSSNDDLLISKSIDNSEGEHTHHESTYMQVLDTPEKGIIINAKYTNGKAYFVVSYDNYCISNHEWSIYEYDVATGAVKEVFRCSGQVMSVVKSENSNDKYNKWAWTQDNDKYMLSEQMTETEDGFIYTPEILNTFGVWLSPVITCNKLFLYLPQDSLDEKCHIISFDLETGEKKNVYDSENKIFMQEGYDKLQISEVETVDNIRSKLTVMEYDPLTDELRTITENEETKLYDTAISDLNAYITKPLDEKRCELVTEKYRIKTDIKNASVLYASDKKAIIKTLGEQFIMHTFDLEKMEHYVTDFNGKAGQLAAYGEGILFYGSRLVGQTYGNLYYLIPEMGLTFTVQENISIDMLINSNDTVTFTQSDMSGILTEDNELTIVNYIKPMFLNWIEERK